MPQLHYTRCPGDESQSAYFEGWQAPGRILKNRPIISIVVMKFLERLGHRLGNSPECLVKIPLCVCQEPPGCHHKPLHRPASRQRIRRRSPSIWSINFSSVGWAAGSHLVYALWAKGIFTFINTKCI